MMQQGDDIVARINAYEGSGGHDDNVGGSLHDLAEDAKQEVIYLRRLIERAMAALATNEKSREQIRAILAGEAAE